MAAYDSDSSGGEETDFTSTNVLLGYAVKEPTDDDVSQLGGYPVSRPKYIKQFHTYLATDMDRFHPSPCHSS